MANRLSSQSSPYLLQHAENPVDWYPWGEEAFEKAKKEDKPIFLSIGYSTCHWCHVMARESFENKEIAEILNRYFVSVKVDREERPDIDSVYMAVCQALTGSGGWPMSIFMTAQQKPFFAGTYFPVKPSYGMMGFGSLLRIIAERWQENRTELLESAEEIVSHIASGNSTGKEDINPRLPHQAAEDFAQSFDEINGGFGLAPKFPVPHNLLFLMLYSRLNQDKEAFRLADITLKQMRRGGIYDHIGCGFSRYSTDKYFFVPHFEKMLYDNALLTIAYCAAYKASGDGEFLDTARETAEYVLREMTGDDGAFYSAQDADSEGEEGKFYVWDYEEIIGILGEEKGKRFCEYFSVTKQGNFQGKNIPNLLNGNKITNIFQKERELLYEFRKNRAELHLDDKILTSWNSLMICALSVLYRVTGDRRYLEAAIKAQEWIEAHLARGNILFVSCREGICSVKGFLDEYAYYTASLLWIYEVTSRHTYLERAEQICGEAVRQFADEQGGFFLYGQENSSLITRPKETYDGALPSGNSVMAYCLVQLSQLTRREEYSRMAQKQLAFLSGEAGWYPVGHSMFLLSQLLYFHPPQQIIVVLSEGECAEKIMTCLPLNAHLEFLVEETEEYKLLNNRTTYYICENHMCLPPSNEIPGEDGAKRTVPGTV